LLVFTRGTIHVTTDAAFRSVYSIKRSPVPSRKPEEFYGLIAKATPGLRRIELFNRARKPNETSTFDKHGAPKGFNIWGYEAARRRKAS
jgi:N6-adenosine-specific RNA methylase IME4